MKKIYSFCFLIIILFTFSCCDKKEVSTEKLYHEYFPVDIGHWVIYDVNYIIYDDFTGEVDTFYYQLKEVIHSEFTDDSGKKAVRIERFTRQSIDDNWEIKNVWTSKLLPSRAEKVEDNLRYIKLAFPPKRNKTWDGNAYNIKPEKTYRITDIHSPQTVNNITFDSVVTVLQADIETLISEEYKIEMYAKNIGLIYKEYIDLTKEIDGTIISGVNFKFSVLDYSENIVNK